MTRLLFLTLLFFHLSIVSAGSNKLALDFMYFDYEEFSPTGFSYDRETGFIPGLSATLVRNQHELKMSFYAGRVDYDGHTQTLAPHKTKTDEILFKIFYRYNIEPDPDITKPRFFVGLGHQYWLRSIQPNNGIYGLDETYTWLQVEAGTRLTILSEANKTIILEAGLLRTLNGNIRIDLSDQGYGTPNLDLGSTNGYQIKAVGRIVTGINRELEIGINYTQWGFGRSNSKTLNNGFQTITIEEPRSETQQTLFYIGLNQNF